MKTTTTISMTPLQTVLAKYANKSIDFATYNKIIKECKKLVGHGISAAYFYKATTKSFGILTYDKIRKSCLEAASSTGSFHPAVCQFNPKKHTKKVEDDDIE